MIKFRIPSSIATIVALAAGVIAVLNQTTFGFVQPWKTGLTVALALVAGLGISPDKGTAFRNALHLGPKVLIFITTGMTALTLAVSTLSMDGTTKGLIMGILTMLTGLGFGQATAAAPSSVQPAHPVA